MGIQEILEKQKQKNIFCSQPTHCEKLSGGTVSELYLLHCDDAKYVVKLNDPKVTASEAFFLRFYETINLLPKLLYVDPANQYIIYSFLEGSIDYTRENKKRLLKFLVLNLINDYRNVPEEMGWGLADNPALSWQDFIYTELLDANKIICSRLAEAEHAFIFSLALKINSGREPYLLHGDCGVHNFIFQGQQLVGVIDPAPVIGDPVYDLVYAFCSSPDYLTKETFDFTVSHLTIGNGKVERVVYENVLIGLYLRLAICIKHHPWDEEGYLKAWHYWMEIIKSS